MAAYPKLIDQRQKGHFAADPWVIAVAIERGLHLVTLERLTGKANRPNIPDVCADAAFKAPCINLLDLIRREKWVLKWARNRFCILAKPPQGEEHHGRGRGIPVEHLREENPMRHKR